MTTMRQQVADDLRSRIADGEFKVGTKLPGVPQIALEYGCSWEVARRAIWILAGEGLVGRPQQGRPTHVIARPEPAPPSPGELLAEVQEAHRDLGVKLEALAAALTE